MTPNLFDIYCSLRRVGLVGCIPSVLMYDINDVIKRRDGYRCRDILISCFPILVEPICCSNFSPCSVLQVPYSPPCHDHVKIFISVLILIFKAVMQTRSTNLRGSGYVTLLATLSLSLLANWKIDLQTLYLPLKGIYYPWHLVSLRTPLIGRKAFLNLLGCELVTIYHHCDCMSIT